MDIPSSPEVRSAVESLVYREASYATIDAIRAAQHAATRKAALSEALLMFECQVSFKEIERWLKTEVEAP